MAKAIQFVKSHVPEALIPHSYATASVVAWIIYCASQYFAPFHNYLHRELLNESS